ncbi:hypothetical protein LCGC14_3150690, partial [marine sediment metagenome]
QLLEGDALRLRYSGRGAGEVGELGRADCQLLVVQLDAEDGLVGD